MNLLLDTHIFLWAVADPDRLTRKMRMEIVDPNNAVFVSSVSAWEITIKKQLGKLDAPADLFEEVARRGMSELPLRFAHARELEGLPPHHGDPFDRMLVSQARTENLRLVTVDRKFQLYDVVLFGTSGKA